MKKKTALFMTSLLGVTSLALASCKTNVRLIDNITCDHEYVFVKITLEPTCFDEGQRLMECIECGKEKTEVLEKAPHREKTVPGKAATCTEDGWTDAIVCDVCRQILDYADYIPATGHADEDCDFTCDVCGVAAFDFATVILGEQAVGNTYRIGELGDMYSSSLCVGVGDGSSGSGIEIKYEFGKVSYCCPLMDYESHPFDIVYGEGYIDVTIKAGTFLIDDYEHVISEDAAVISTKGSVRRIVAL